MKGRLKTIVLSALGAISAFGAVTYSSCAPDKCKAIVCAYGGVCREGVCYCPTGYEGYQCETITRDKYKGTWHIEEQGTKTNPAQYTLTIDYGETMTDMVISNFYNKLVSPVNVRVKGDTMYIPQQEVDGYQLQGIGYLSESKYYGYNAELKVYYTIKLPDGRVNDFGTNGFTNPSRWNK